MKKLICLFIALITHFGSFLFSDICEIYTDDERRDIFMYKEICFSNNSVIYKNVDDVLFMCDLLKKTTDYGEKKILKTNIKSLVQLYIFKLQSGVKHMEEMIVGYENLIAETTSADRISQIQVFWGKHYVQKEELLKSISKVESFLDSVLAER